MVWSQGSQPVLGVSKSGKAGRTGVCSGAGWRRPVDSAARDRFGVAAFGLGTGLEAVGSGPGGGGAAAPPADPAALAAASRIEPARFLRGRRGSAGGNLHLGREMDAQCAPAGIEPRGPIAPLGQHPPQADLTLVRPDPHEELILALAHVNLVLTRT